MTRDGATRHAAVGAQLVADCRAAGPRSKFLSAVSPCGFTAGGLPLALQVAGRPFDEATVLRIVHVYEQAAGWSGRRPAALS